jgi:hypothetical protein
MERSSFERADAQEEVQPKMIKNNFQYRFAYRGCQFSLSFRILKIDKIGQNHPRSQYRFAYYL